MTGNGGHEPNQKRDPKSIPVREWAGNNIIIGELSYYEPGSEGE